MPEIHSAVRTKYLEGDKTFHIRKHLEELEKEEKSGLKGIEIREKAKELGKDDFLKILITQLSQQDPTNPMKDQDFIAQMAQFSSLEQMKNISTGISRMESKQAYSIVGKLVSGPDLVTGDDVVGIAGAIFFDGDGKTYVRVNGRTIDIEKIHFISDPSLLESSSATNTDLQSNNEESKNSTSEIQERFSNRNLSVNRSHAVHAYEENIPGYRPSLEENESNQ